MLTRLKPEFPEVSISKIRFLESEGLVTPHRTPSGYRQFSAADVERLRYVLAAQRDQYLPLRVIKDHLDAIDRGLEPAVAGGPAAAVAGRSPTDPSPRDFAATTEVRMTRAELLAESGLTATSLAELEQFGLIVGRSGRVLRRRRRARRRTAAELLAVGLEPRHLRSFRTAADREATLITQLVSAQAQQRDPDARERAGRRGRPVGGHDPAPALPVGEGRITARSRSLRLARRGAADGPARTSRSRPDV